jgi:23S rRNA pseudouridine955/2504/2580 synthase
VAGDAKHGDFAFNRELKAKWGLNRLFLHSTRLEVPHPEDGRKLVMESKLPEELVEVLGRAGLEQRPEPKLQKKEEA